MKAKATADVAGEDQAREGSGFRLAVAVLAWLILGVIVFSTLSPLGMRPRLGVFVHVERFGAFALMGLLFALVYSRRVIAVLACVVAAVIGLELLQMAVSDRHARFSDLAVKAAGGVFGVACGWFIMRNRARIEHLLYRPRGGERQSK